MEMQVNASLCTGCGACAEICTAGAIHLRNGLAVLDQAACTQCRACVDVCPVGAIAVVELPVVTMVPAAVQKSQAVVAKPVPSDPKSWLSAFLAFAGREILPRLVDALIAEVDRRLAQSARTPVYLPAQEDRLVPTQNRGCGERRRRRYGQVRHRQS